MTDSNKSESIPRKLMDVSRLHAMGWEATISLDDGLRANCVWFVENESALRG